MPSTSLRTLFTAAWLIASASVLRAQSYPTNAGNNPYDLSDDEMLLWLAHPNATGVRDRVMGPDMKDPLFFSGSDTWNMTYVIRNDIPIARGNETAQRNDFDRTKFFTASRISFNHRRDMQPLGPESNSSTDVRQCIVYGQTANRDFFASNPNGQEATGNCEFLSKECRDDFATAMRRLSSSTRANAANGCFGNPQMPDSCKDVLGWASMVGTQPMNNSALHQGGTMFQWGSQAHDAGNLTDYHNALRRVFGAFFYYNYYDRTDNGTLRYRGTTYPGFQCIRAANVTEGSQGTSAASTVGGLSLGWLLAAATMIMAMM